MTAIRTIAIRSAEQPSLLFSSLLFSSLLFAPCLPSAKRDFRAGAGLVLFTSRRRPHLAALALHLAAAAASAQTAGTIDTIAGTGTAGYNLLHDGAAAASAQLNNPRDVAVDAAGNIYIADSNNNRIRKVTPAGVISTVAGTGIEGFSGDGAAATSAQINNPFAVAADAAGNLYVADTNNHRIRKVDTAGVITTYAGTTQGFSGDGGPATSAQINSPTDLTFDGAGNLYISDTNNLRIRRVDAGTGNISTVAGGGSSPGDNVPATSAQIGTTGNVAFDGAGNLYIGDLWNHRIRKVDTAGVITTFAGTGIAGFSGDGGPAASAQLDSPGGLALDNAGNLYVSDPGNERIRRVDAATGNISTVAGGGSSLGDGGPALSAQLNSAAGITLDCAGNLYVADLNDHRVRKVYALSAPSCPVTEETVPAVFAGPLALSFMAAQDGEPQEQEIMLYAQDGEADFLLVPGVRWIAAAPRRGKLADGERTTVTVTVDPTGLSEGTRNGRLYVRSGGRVTSWVRVALEVLPPNGPAVSENVGVINAARMSAYGDPGLFGPRLLPLAPGSAVIVQGANFASGERMEAASYPLPTMLGGARVLIDDVAVPLMAVGPQRIEAQLPWALGGEAVAAGGLALAAVVVETGGESSYPRRFWAAPHAPGVFTVSGEGQGQAMVMFAETTDLAAPLGFRAGSRPARPGDLLEIYATGLGAVEPPLADGMTSCPPDGVCLEDGSNIVTRLTAARPQVWIDAYAVSPENVRFSGLAPDMVGVNLVIVEVPRNLVPSDAAQLRLAVGGRMSQSGATIAVE